MKATSLVSWKVPTTSHGFHRVRGVPLVWLASAAIVLASCNVQWEAPSYGYDVWNYTLNQYFVVVTAEDGSLYTTAVGPYAVVGSSGGSPFKHASVYDENCTTDLADIAIPPGATEIVISESGAISVSTNRVVRPGPSDPQIQRPMPVPSSCMHFDQRAVSQQP